MSDIEQVDMILRQKITEIQAFQNDMDVLNRARKSQPPLAQPFWQDPDKPHLTDIRDRFMQFLFSLVVSVPAKADASRTYLSLFCNTG